MKRILAGQVISSCRLCWFIRYAQANPGECVFECTHPDTPKSAQPKMPDGGRGLAVLARSNKMISSIDIPLWCPLQKP